MYVFQPKADPPRADKTSAITLGDLSPEDELYHYYFFLLTSFQKKILPKIRKTRRITQVIVPKNPAFPIIPPYPPYPIISYHHLSLSRIVGKSNQNQ